MSSCIASRPPPWVNRDLLCAPLRLTRGATVPTRSARDGSGMTLLGISRYKCSRSAELRTTLGRANEVKGPGFTRSNPHRRSGPPFIAAPARFFDRPS
jgi:hypothetical protein